MRPGRSPGRAFFDNRCSTIVLCRRLPSAASSGARNPTLALCAAPAVVRASRFRRVQHRDEARPSPRLLQGRACVPRAVRRADGVASGKRLAAATRKSLEPSTRRRRSDAGEIASASRARQSVSARLAERLRALLPLGALASSAASRRLSCRTAAAGAFDLPLGGGAEVLLLCACPARYRLDQPGPPGCTMRYRACGSGRLNPSLRSFVLLLCGSEAAMVGPMVFRTRKCCASQPE